MSNTKISALTSATTPLAGSEVLPIVQSGTTKQVSVDNLTTGKTVTVGSLSVTGTTPRITADMSNATQASRLMFQTTTANSTTSVGVIPNGTGTSARVNLFNSSDPDNAGYVQFNSSTTAAIINSSKLGTGTTLPIRLQIDGSTQVELSTAGNLTLFTGNIVQGTAAKGFDFSANTAAAGKTSQLLNWYEEGTFTPSDSSGASLSFTNTSGFYTRIGRLVTCHVQFQFPVTTNGSQARIALPFTAKNDTNSGGGVFYVNNPGTGLSGCQPVVVGNQSYFLLSNVAAGTAYLNVDASGNYFRGTVIYIV